MSDTYRLNGSYGTTPTIGSPSGQPSLETPISEVASLIKKSVQQYTLSDEDPVSVSFGGLAQAQILNIRTVGGKIRLRITTADGVQQAFSVDPFLALISMSSPITAIDLTRVPGVETVVTVFLGQTN